MSKKITQSKDNQSTSVIKMTEGAETPFLLYAGYDEKVHVRVLVYAETLWLPLAQLAELFGIQNPGISKHLKNIYDSGELTREATISKMETVQREGERLVRRSIDYYNLDAIIAVGYRVNSRRATQFRIWATQILKEYIKKGFVLDDERLKQGKQVFGEDYFQELLERVRSIRTSERRIYQQITDIFAECSVDYDPSSDITQCFYAMVQNKFHYAITGHTAAEIIYNKADRSVPNMGLLNWKNSPTGRILSSDVTIAKNYLSESEIKRLERTVFGFFDYIENIIERRVQMYMADMATSVDKFLSFNEYEVLTHKGRVSRIEADRKARAEYAEFNKTQKIESDFDRAVKQTLVAAREQYTLKQNKVKQQVENKGQGKK